MGSGIRETAIMGISATITQTKFIEKDLEDVGPTRFLRIWFEGEGVSMQFDWECHKPDLEDEVEEMFQVGDLYTIGLASTFFEGEAAEISKN